MGLAMSRSLGDDIAHQAGVSSEPEVMEHEIDANDQVLGRAGRGRWEKEAESRWQKGRAGDRSHRVGGRDTGQEPRGTEGGRGTG